MKKKLFIEPWPRIIGIPLVGFFTAFLFNDWPFPWYEFLVSTLFVGVMWNGDYFIISLFRKKIPSLENTPKRIGLTVLIICMYNISADYLLCNFLSYVDLSHDYWQENPFKSIAKNLGITAVIGTLYEAGYFFSKWKRQTIETEQLRTLQLKSELSVLKNQISPHFLFNSLNTLVTLIQENPPQAAKFTEKLSEVYRYILQYKEKELVLVKTEIRFIKAYLFLLKMRFEEGVDLNINIPSDYLDKYIAPLTLQMLIENAVKHNVVSRKNPLSIDIYVENGKSLIVRNNLHLKSAEGRSTFTGLENIKSRYKYLSNQPVDVIETRDHFMVALPLISLSQDAQAVFEDTSI